MTTAIGPEAVIDTSSSQEDYRSIRKQNAGETIDKFCRCANEVLKTGVDAYIKDERKQIREVLYGAADCSTEKSANIAKAVTNKSIDCCNSDSNPDANADRGWCVIN